MKTVKTRRALLASLLAAAAVFSAGCSINNTGDSSSAETTASAADSAQQTAAPSAETDAPKTDAPKEDVPSDNKASVTLEGASAKLSDGAKGIEVSGSVVTITAGGEYTFEGKLDDGSIVVNVPKTDKVDIYLKNVEISSSSSAPVRVEQADGVTLHLEDGTVNTFKDSASNSFSACISAKDDLTIKGTGTLNVTGVAKHGIKSSNDVKIKNGIINISSAATAIYGEDMVQLTGGKITIESCKDGIKASNETESDKGYVSSEDTEVDIKNASGNGIEAITYVKVKSGSIRIHSVKNAVNCTNQELAEGCVTTY